MKSLFLVIVPFTLLIVFGCKSERPESSKPKPDSSVSTTESVSLKTEIPEKPKEVLDAPEATEKEIVLFDGTEMGQWVAAKYEEGGKVELKDGMIVMDKGNDMTGIRWTGPIMRMNYELTLEAMRIEGEDFFCGLTFPYGKDPCTLICGGWGGSLVGLSNIDYYDAANNQTGTSRTFENGKWYPIRIRITPAKIEAWIDGDDKIIDFETADHKIGIRFEVEPCKPLGIATWRTTGSVRNIKIVRITP